MRGGLVKGGIALAVLAAIAGFTNPKQDAYNDYAAKKLLAGAQKGICKQTGYCESGEPPTIIKDKIVKPAIDVATVRQNLVVFSLYKTDFPGVKTYKSLGAFNNFFTYSEQ
jgi:Domain of unknown function (DUF4359)